MLSQLAAAYYFAHFMIILPLVVAGVILLIQGPLDGLGRLLDGVQPLGRPGYDGVRATIGRLEASERRNRQFVADVAHELRTPLTALLGEAALIEADLDRLQVQRVDGAGIGDARI